MSSDHIDPATREALRRLGNPYAKLELPDEAFVAEGLFPNPLTAAERAYVREMQNPYASLSVSDDGASISQDSLARPADSDGRRKGTHRTISKDRFEAECRRIFRQYIPAIENGRLRPHHREFIVRNIARSPEVRSRLIEKLREYDLSDLPGFTPMFNRERDSLTKSKLENIEASVVAEES